MYTLAIESSCDETAVAIVRDGREVLCNLIASQIDVHKAFGGVVPEIASRMHLEAINPLLALAFRETGLSMADIDLISVTRGPGLVGALLVGVSYAKGLALSHNLPLVGTNHILGHIAANYLTFPDLEPPFTALIASGGHSHIVRVEDFDRCTLIGRTRDDAAGEAFDKVARVLGLPYPGGPELEKLAKQGDPKAIRFRSAFNERDDAFDMSFSGLKTAVINVLHTAEQRGEQVNRADVAASFQFEVVSILSDKAVRACSDTLVLAGGVSANAALREMLAKKAKKKGIRFCCPDFRYCTDNAAMIGSAGFYLLMKGHRDGLDLNATPYLSVV